MAECHPVGFQWVMEAKARGATIIHVDPRFTRTSAMADVYVPVRAGSDIAFLGGIINYILTNEMYFREYVVSYTNAATIVSEDFQDADQLGGLFSGFDPTTGTYDTTSWAYEGMETAAAAGSRVVAGRQPRGARRWGRHELGWPSARPCHTARSAATRRCRIPSASFRFSSATTRGTRPRWSSGSAASLPSSSPRCARRSPPTAVASAPRRGCIRSDGRSTPSACSTSAVRRSSSCCSATSVGRAAASSRCAATRASRDRPTFQRSSICFPAISRCRRRGCTRNLDEYLASIKSDGQKGFWTAADTYIVSLLKAWWGDAATPENDFGFDWLPRISGDHSNYQTIVDMLDDKVEGYFLLGQNPAVGSANGKLQRLAMSHLKWLVVRDLNLIESATFWKDGPEIATGEMRTEDIGDRGVLPAGRGAHGEGRHLHADAAPAPVASQGSRAAGRLSQRAALLLSPRQAASRTARDVNARARRAAATARVGLSAARRRRARRGGGVARDQRPPPQRREGRAACSAASSR